MGGKPGERQASSFAGEVEKIGRTWLVLGSTGDEIGFDL